MKIVMIINKELPVGLIANAAAVLGVSLGKACGEIVGEIVKDLDGKEHQGITQATIPVLSGTREQIKQIRDTLYDEGYREVNVIDFSEIAQKSLDYERYSLLMANAASADLYYLGLCLFGPDKKVNRLTGSMGLLR